MQDARFWSSNNGERQCTGNIVGQNCRRVGHSGLLGPEKDLQKTHGLLNPSPFQDKSVFSYLLLYLFGCFRCSTPRANNSTPVADASHASDETCQKIFTDVSYSYANKACYILIFCLILIRRGFYLNSTQNRSPRNTDLLKASFLVLGQEGVAHHAVFLCASVKKVHFEYCRASSSCLNPKTGFPIQQRSIPAIHPNIFQITKHSQGT